MNGYFDIASYRERIKKAAETIVARITAVPEILIVLGSGLGSLADQVENAIIIPYAQIPGFPSATIPGHAGELIVGHWQNRSVVVMKGRFHAYEGHDPKDLVLPIRVFQHLGTKALILTNAAGGVDASMNPGELMLIRDHISLWADSPLRGINLDEFGPRFPDQTRIYDRDFAELARHCASKLNIPLNEGVYAYCKGPQFETPAEIRLLRLLGASAVGMSTVPEAIAGSHGGMRILAFSCITNLAAGILDQPLSHTEVLEVGAMAEKSTVKLLSEIIRQMPDFY